MIKMIVAGLDVAFSNDYMALVIVEINDNGNAKLVHLATWRKMDWHLWKFDMKLKQSKFNIDCIYVDQTNNQSVLMELHEIGIRAEGVSFSNSSKHDMIRNATKLIVTGELIMPIRSKIKSVLQKKLVEELYTQLYEQEYNHDSVNPKLSHPQGRHDDLLWALCLALYKFALNPDYGPPVAVGFSLYDYDERSPVEKITDDVMSRFEGGGIVVTGVKVTMPGENQDSWEF